MELVNPTRSQNWRKILPRSVRRICAWTLTPRLLFVAGADSTSQPGSYFLWQCLWQCIRPPERKGNMAVVCQSSPENKFESHWSAVL
jgi:hypothetical protein